MTKPSKEKLIELYWNRNKTLQEIADIYGYKDSEAIRYHMKKFGIKRRIAAKRDQRGPKNHFFGKGDRQRGAKNHNWKGGFKKCGEYIKILRPEHSRADQKGYILEHIIVMEKHIGRQLKYYGKGLGKNEIVHHKNEIKTDNMINNLQLMTHSEHMRFHRLNKHKR